MKALFLTLALLLPQFASAQADTPEVTQLLSTLIFNASKVQLESETGESIESTLPDLLAAILSTDVLGTADGDYAQINSIGSKCELEGNSKEGTLWECTLRINNGDFLKQQNTYTGPTLESSWTFTFKTVKPKGRAHQLRGKKVSMMLAG